MHGNKIKYNYKEELLLLFYKSYIIRYFWEIVLTVIEKLIITGNQK